MEAESYLTGGYGIRLAMKSQRIRSVSVGDIATAWQPSRLKGIQLDKDQGTPFLAATQVFDLRPSPRKYLSLDRTENAEGRFIENGAIVITCSGTVGRATLIYAAHEGVLISHDLLRIAPKDSKYWGWLYAFFRSSRAQEMMTSAQYGHMIKHLEPSHIHELPLPVPRDGLLEAFQNDVQRVLDLRNEAWRLQGVAEAIFSKEVGPVPDVLDRAETGFVIRASDFLERRRRLEATFHSPEVSTIVSRFHQAGRQVDSLQDLTEGVWWLSRFKRVFGSEGDRYLSADDLFSLNPGVKKRVIVEQAVNPDAYRVKAGWIIMACSGQVYGLNGHVALMSKHHEDAFFSHDLIRIVPDQKKIRPGYLHTALGHPELGRPLVIRNAYGTSIPHLEPDDVANIPIVRLSRRLEDKIADAMERAIEMRGEADALENVIADRADELLEKYLMGDSHSFNAMVS